MSITFIPSTSVSCHVHMLARLCMVTHILTFLCTSIHPHIHIIILCTVNYTYTHFVTEHCQPFISHSYVSLACLCMVTHVLSIYLYMYTIILHNASYTYFHLITERSRSSIFTIHMYRGLTYTDGVGPSPDLLWAMVQIFFCLRAVF